MLKQISLFLSDDTRETKISDRFLASCTDMFLHFIGQEFFKSLGSDILFGEVRVKGLLVSYFEFDEKPGELKDHGEVFGMNADPIHGSQYTTFPVLQRGLQFFGIKLFQRGETTC